MADEAAAVFFRKAGCEPFVFNWLLDGNVPLSRGLGSSVTLRLGLLHGLNELSGRPLSREQLFRACFELEGHPDNAAPGEFGGFTVGSLPIRFEVAPELRFVLLIPELELRTADARRVLPAQLDRLAAVRSAGNACRITAAFAAQRYELLRGAFGDEFHQPFRQPLVPFLNGVIRAGEQAGALGGFLSGSGSAVCCVTLDAPELVAESMLAAAGVPAHTMITCADNQGAHVLAQIAQ
jgi:homoserine kinase